MSRRPVKGIHAPAPEELVARMAQGNEEALSQLFDQLSGVLYSLASRILGDEADASEVTLDAFTYAWKTAGAFNRTRGSVTTWLCVLVRSRAIDRLRSRQSHLTKIEKAQRAHPGDQPAMGTAPGRVSGAVETAEKRRNIEHALTQLAPEQHRAIELAYFEGLSQSEIARLLETPLGTIKTRIRTGMQKLKAILEPLYADELR